MSTSRGWGVGRHDSGMGTKPGDTILSVGYAKGREDLVTYTRRATGQTPDVE